jgi:hypothetical protein
MLIRTISALALVLVAGSPAAADVAPSPDPMGTFAIVVALIGAASIGYYFYRRRK